MNTSYTAEASTSKLPSQPQACDQCSAVKRKCIPAGNGCKACLAAGKSCTFERVRRKRGPRRGHAQETESRMERMATALRNVLAKCDSDTESMIRETLLEEDLLLPSPQARETSLGRIDKRSEDAESSLTDMAGVLTLNDNSELRYFGKMSGLNLLDQPSSPTGTFPLPRTIRLTLLPEQQAHSRSAIPSAPFSSAPVMEQANSVPLLPFAASNSSGMYTLPDAVTQSRLLTAYWAHVHPHLPILYRPALTDRLPRPSTFSSTEPLGSKDDLCPPFLALAVFAVAARFVRDGQETPRAGAHWAAGDKYVAQAKWLLANEEFNFRDLGSSRLTTVQGLLLLAYREAGIGAMCHSWFLGGSAFRMAVDIALYRDPDLLSQNAALLPYEIKESRKRTWFGCVAFDRYICMYMGRPMTLMEKDWDTGLPGTDEPDEHERWRPVPLFAADSTTDSGRQSTKAHAISCFNHATRLNVILARVADDLYAIRKDRLAADPVTLLRKREQELRTFMEDLPPHLHCSMEEGHMPAPHIIVLHCQYYCIQILIHMPFIFSAEIAQRSTDAVAIAASRIARLVVLHDQLYGMTQTAPFMVFYIWSAGLVHLFLVTRHKDRMESRDHLKSCINALEKMETTWGGASRQREMLLAPFQNHPRPGRDSAALNGNGNGVHNGKGRDDDDTRIQQEYPDYQDSDRRTRPRFADGYVTPKREEVSPSGAALHATQASTNALSSLLPQMDAQYPLNPNATTTTSGLQSDFTFTLGTEDPFYPLWAAVPIAPNAGYSPLDATGYLSNSLDDYMQSLQPDYENHLYLPPLSYFLASPDQTPGNNTPAQHQM